MNKQRRNQVKSFHRGSIRKFRSSSNKKQAANMQHSQNDLEPPRPTISMDGLERVDSLLCSILSLKVSIDMEMM
jgi:hypothetical protein